MGGTDSGIFVLEYEKRGGMLSYREGEGLFEAVYD